MSEHHATIDWSRGATEFTYQTYPRNHTWSFVSGVQVAASSAPGYLGDPDRVDPEEAFVAALSSCHMLTFLAIAAKKRFVVDQYQDAAVGHMEKNAEGELAVTRVVLRPRVTFAERSEPSVAELDKLHNSAHRHCFIANSVRTEIVVESA